MPNRNILFLILSILIGIFLGIGFVYLSIFNKNYVAVFLNNGAIYFGQLSTFPQLKLEKAIFPVFDQNGNLVSFQRFSDAFWQPQGFIYLNPRNVLFVAPVNKNSLIINLIEGKVPPSTSPTQPQRPSQPQPPTQPQQPSQPNQPQQPQP